MGKIYAAVYNSLNRNAFRIKQYHNHKKQHKHHFTKQRAKAENTMSTTHHISPWLLRPLPWCTPFFLRMTRPSPSQIKNLYFPAKRNKIKNDTSTHKPRTQISGGIQQSQLLYLLQALRMLVFKRSRTFPMTSQIRLSQVYHEILLLEAINLAKLLKIIKTIN